MKNQDPKEILESIIDYSGLFATLELIEVICEEKADHIKSNWQDDSTAAVWRRAAKRINTCKYKRDVVLA